MTGTRAVSVLTSTANRPIDLGSNAGGSLGLTDAELDRVTTPKLMIGDATGVAKPRTIALPSTAFFSGPAWSPDGTQILLQDNHRNLWTIEVAPVISRWLVRTPTRAY